MDASRSRDAAILRLAIGLAQGVLLFLLQKADESKAWPATQPMLYAPLLVCVLMVPLLPLAALSAMRRRNLLIWSAVATAVNGGAAWVVSQFFLTLIDAIGNSATFFLFAAFSVLAWLWIWRRVPETKGRSLEEVQEIWDQADPVAAQRATGEA